MKKLNITLIKGDGIGPEVTLSAKTVLDFLVDHIMWEAVEVGDSALESTGELVPQYALDSIERTRLVLKGPLTTPIGEGFRSVNVHLRKQFDLFSNIRPAKSIEGVKTRYDDVDLIVFRENTEDLYAGIEMRVDENTRHSIKVITRSGSERIIRAAFEYADKNAKGKVTLVHKANILKETDGLFLEVGTQISKAYPHIKFEPIIVDNMCMQLVLEPNQFDVIVTMNLYGDILSDLCSGLVGGLGLSPSANIGKGYAIFEPVHGSAPDIAGKNRANPTAILFSSAMLLRHVGEGEKALLLENAVKAVLRNSQNHTADLGGTMTTTGFTEAVINTLSEGSE